MIITYQYHSYHMNHTNCVIFPFLSVSLIPNVTHSALFLSLPSLTCSFRNFDFSRPPIQPTPDIPLTTLPPLSWDTSTSLHINDKIIITIPQIFHKGRNHFRYSSPLWNVLPPSVLRHLLHSVMILPLLFSSLPFERGRTSKLPPPLELHAIPD